MDNRRSLREDAKALANSLGSPNYVDIHFYLKGRDGEGDGIGWRQCTNNYKIRPIRRRIRELLVLSRGSGFPPDSPSRSQLNTSRDL